MTDTPGPNRIIAVTGGRTYDDLATVRRVIAYYSPSMVIHGGATGADSLAEAGSPVSRAAADALSRCNDVGKTPAADGAVVGMRLWPNRPSLWLRAAQGRAVL